MQDACGLPGLELGEGAAKPADFVLVEESLLEYSFVRAGRAFGADGPCGVRVVHQLNVVVDGSAYVAARLPFPGQVLPVDW